MEIDLVLNYAIEKIKKTMRLREFPHITNNNIWQTTSDGYWTGGFWIGLLWWAYKITEDELFKKEAYRWLGLLEKRKISRTFDLGFIFTPSFVLGYKMTNDMHLRKVALEAAETLLTTYNEKLELMYDEIIINGKKFGEIIIDIMPNLSLLWWAHEETGNEKYFNTANAHSLRTIEELVREDGSTFQGMLIDLKTSEIIKKCTFQGINVDSCWSRGQAWGIYGFIIAYKATRNKKFLETAKMLSNYFVSNSPEDCIPYWDFNAPKRPDTIRDSSAAAIASSGLLEIYKHSLEMKFKEDALKILNSLSNNYLTNKNKDGILAQGCFYKPKNLGVKESLIWGDYFFFESLMKIKEY